MSMNITLVQIQENWICFTCVTKVQLKHEKSFIHQVEQVN